MREYTVNRRMTQTYTSTRRSANALNSRTSVSYGYAGAGFSRNRNMVRSDGARGRHVNIALAALAVLLMGLVYINSGTKGTSFDYEIASMDEKISDLEAEKEDLAVEKARLTSIAASENSTVAAAMQDAGRAPSYTE